MNDYVILVDALDREVGVMEKLEAHQKGLLHRAFSVFIFNSKGEILLQQRALSKYHSPGLWTNTCCSHPRPQESTHCAAERRLLEEMGMSTPLNETFAFTYHAAFDNGLIEHEYDHVFFGWSDQAPVINYEEVSDYRYISIADLQQWLSEDPDAFTVWFKICFPNVLTTLKRVA